MSKPKRGRLTVIGGPMYAGKTTKLLAIYNILSLQGKSVLCFKAEMDSNGGIGHTNSHDEKSLPVIFIHQEHPEKILRFIGNDGVKSAIIDAVNFLPPVKTAAVVKKILAKGIDVYANGLIWDFRKKEFGATLTLMKMADEKIKLYAVCVRCLGKAEHTERIQGGSRQKISSKKAKYISTCAKCHNVYHSK